MIGDVLLKNLNCLQHKYGSDCYDACSFKPSTLSSLCCQYCKTLLGIYPVLQFDHLLIWKQSCVCVIYLYHFIFVSVNYNSTVGVNVVKNKNIKTVTHWNLMRVLQKVAFQMCKSVLILMLNFCIKTSHKMIQFLPVTYGLLRIHPCTYNLINCLVEWIWRGKD